MEGTRARYVGEDAMIGAGTLGKVLAVAGQRSYHVQWTEGYRSGNVDIVSVDDLVPAMASQQDPMSVQAQFDASFEMPTLTTIAVRDTYDDYGEDGLLNALGEHGHLATLAEYAQGAIDTLAGHLRTDATFSTILAQLDQPEADSLVQRVAVSLLVAQTEED